MVIMLNFISWKLVLMERIGWCIGMVKIIRYFKLIMM